MYFVDVILPIPLKQTFTYGVNQDEARFLKKGMRVAVPFGTNKVYTGIVYQVHRTPPIGYDTREIDHILDETPLMTSKQLEHWEWLASYYMCTLGEVVRAALPSAFLLESETILRLSGKPIEDELVLSDEEFTLIEALQHQTSLHINDVRSILERRNVVKLIKKLLEKGLIEVEEQVQEIYKPKLVRYVKFSEEYRSEDGMRNLLDNMGRAPKQKEMVIALYMLLNQQSAPVTVSLLKIRSGGNSTTIKALEDKGVFETYYIRHDRVEFEGRDVAEVKTLTEAQQTAYEEIDDHFQTKDIVLLHGVTSSGKTELYVQRIADMLSSGRQVLYMLPEIALTTQLISRLQRYFGESISVYHSKYSLNERVEVWNNVLNKMPKSQIVIGARSAMFLPFTDLGLLIVDEAHEPSFKQYNPAPRYHARDSGIVLAGMHKAKAIIGSATPSLESRFNAENEKYGYVSLTQRYGNVLMPEIELVDIKEKHRRKLMTGHFSDRLLEEMREALQSNEQVLLFQNRRGFSPFVECTTCGVSPQCPNCDVSLTYHQYRNELRCHYCGHNTPMMISCIACGSETLDTKGFGTEQIEEEVKSLFPDHRVARMDQDTTRGKNAYGKLIEAIEQHEVDIVVGTQMLAKGLDFRNISLVGVMNADNLLNFPDFRAHERSFQLLQQVSGRAGRTKKRGKVLIQTYNPYHRILQQVSTNDYNGMYTDELEQRYQYKYPPYYRTIKLSIRDRNFNKMQKASIWLGSLFRRKLEERVLGPEQPPVGRIRNQFITNILIKIDREESVISTKEFIQQALRSFAAVKDFSSVRVVVDVDNY